MISPRGLALRHNDAFAQLIQGRKVYVRFAVRGAGTGLHRRRHRLCLGRSVLDYPTQFVARMVMSVGTPALVLATLNRTQLDPTAFTSMALACLLCTLLMALAGLLVCRLSRQDWRVLLPAFMFPNTGNMGLPISLYAFGEQGLALAMAFFLGLSIVQFTVGMAISGTTRRSRRWSATPSSSAWPSLCR